MRIREATIDDLPRLIEMSRHFIEQTAYGRLLAPAPGVLEAFVAFVQEFGVAIVAEDVGTAAGGPQLVGMIGLLAGPHPATGQIMAEEVAWWVEEPYRKGTIGPRLLHAAEAWASAKSVTVLKMVAPAGSNVGGFYSRHGYDALETAFVKRLRS